MAAHTLLARASGLAASAGANASASAMGSDSVVFGSASVVFRARVSADASVACAGKNVEQAVSDSSGQAASAAPLAPSLRYLRRVGGLSVADGSWVAASEAGRLPAPEARRLEAACMAREDDTNRVGGTSPASNLVHLRVHCKTRYRG